MPKFRIPVTWMVNGHYEVEADTIQQACNKVESSEEPYDDLPIGEYVDESMNVDTDSLKEQNSDFDGPQEKCPNCGSNSVVHDDAPVLQPYQDTVNVHCQMCEWEWTEPNLS